MNPGPVELVIILIILAISLVGGLGLFFLIRGQVGNRERTDEPNA